ncbi:uncharacterized protein LOC121414845 [Lytechinus variegatus]|uniref:uncharacterized protein LOC121414845 n=1 Tax=Lytechinus variegatus TaxID=7654 RepID=UPI001BB23412|nr:uncharacterized protein LOC121414845 [Lytechinus variegatus]
MDSRTSGEQGNQIPPLEPKEDSISDAQILWEKVARPLKIPMIIFGLYHEKGTKIIYPESAFKGGSLPFLAMRIYHILIMLYLWFNFARFLVSFQMTGSHHSQDLTYNNISVSSWAFLVAANNTVFLKICYKGDIFQLIANHSKLCFRAVQSEDGASNRRQIQSSWTKYRSFAIGGTIIGLCASCANIAAILFMNYGLEESSIYHRVMCFPWSSDLACGLSAVFAVYGSATWTLTVVFIAFICYIMSGQFAQLTRDFAKTFGERRNFDAKLLDSFRRNFNTLCRSVELADEMLSPFVAIAYCTNIPGIIFLLYQVWFPDIGTGTSYHLIASFWIVGTVLNLAIVSYFAVTVHEKVGTYRYHNMRFISLVRDV